MTLKAYTKKFVLHPDAELQVVIRKMGDEVVLPRRSLDEKRRSATWWPVTVTSLLSETIKLLPFLSPAELLGNDRISLKHKWTEHQDNWAEHKIANCAHLSFKGPIEHRMPRYVITITNFDRTSIHDYNFSSVYFVPLAYPLCAHWLGLVQRRPGKIVVNR